MKAQYTNPSCVNLSFLTTTTSLKVCPKAPSLYVFLIYLGLMGIIKMKFNLNLQGLLRRGDRKFTPVKSSVTDSSSRNFRYLAKIKPIKLLGYPHAQGTFSSIIVNNQIELCDSLLPELNLF